VNWDNVKNWGSFENALYNQIDAMSESDLDSLAILFDNWTERIKQELSGKQVTRRLDFLQKHGMGIQQSNYVIGTTCPSAITPDQDQTGLD
jgi:hypothetical protein